MNPTKGEAPVIGPTEASKSSQTSNRKTDMSDFNSSTPSLATADSLSAVTPTAPVALIPVFTGIMQDKPVQLCDARTLHTFMVVLRDFSNWIKGRIRKFGFVEGTDYLKIIGSPDLANQTRGGNKKETTDYHLTLDMAKELSMVENNENGREARRYFIACEKQVLAALTVHPADRITYKVQPGDKLSADQQETLRFLLESNVKKLPHEKQAGAMIKGWSKLKSHFGVSYRDIPADKFTDALGLLARHVTELVELPAPIADNERINAAMVAANEVASKVQASVFAQLLASGKSWQHERWMLYFNYSHEGAVPCARVIESDAMVTSFDRLAKDIADPGLLMPTNAQLANLASAFNNRLAKRIQTQVPAS